MRTKTFLPPFLWFILFYLLWVVGVWVLAGLLIASSEIPGQWKLDLMVGLALISMSVGLAAILFPLRRRLRAWKGLVPALLGGCFLLPTVALLVPHGLVDRYLLLQPELLSPDYWRNLFSPAPPWLLIIQVSTLWVFLPICFDLRAWLAGFSIRGLLRWVFPSILAGMGLWLIGTFLFSLSMAGFHIPQPVRPPLSIPLNLLLWGAALVIAPVTQELLFRKMLVQQLSQKMPLFWACLVSAALFATLQMRPLLWLPAFVLGLGLSLLFQSTGKLRTVILAHAVINVLTIFLSWTAIL
jgi:membrane protease YdiL (CAAX protease family)